MLLSFTRAVLEVVMPVIRQLKVAPGDVVLLVGTMKGAFLLRADAKRRSFELGGPHFPGEPVYALAFDDRAGRQRLWAGTENPFYGARLRRSDDFGRNWSEVAAPPRFPEGSGGALERIWQVALGRRGEPERLYCGVQPAALFESGDGGESWQLVEGLWNHPHRPRWTPGAGGLCLHTILPHPEDPRALLVAVSAAGVYRSDDAGRSWHTSHAGVRAQFLPDPHPEFGQCVHKVVRHDSRPERLFLQNHWGLYRSDDGGRRWSDVAHGVPSDFGFCMAVHPHRPDCVYIVPLEADTYRCTPGGRLRVYRTTNAGRTWRALTKGLPQKDAHETVLRDALATDGGKPAGIYFGTRSGRVYASRDDGASWREIASGLPPVVCVKTATVAPSQRARSSRRRASGGASRRR
jgi:photosystem II stability/assembly factor-like uncharacterized protein